MKQLEKALNKLRPFLLDEMSEDAVEEWYALPDKEFSEKLKRKGREIGKKQSRYSMNSEEYERLRDYRDMVEQVLKLLNQKEREESGLMAAGSVQEEKKAVVVLEKQKPAFDVEQIRKDYMQAYEQSDIDTMQRIYKDLYSKYAGSSRILTEVFSVVENEEKRNKDRVARMTHQAAQSDVQAVLRLAEMYRQGSCVPEYTEKAQVYLEKAAENDVGDSIYMLAYQLSDMVPTFENYYFKQDKERSYQLFKKYVNQKAPLDMNRKIHKDSLYQCYYQGAMLGHDMEREDVKESWRRLLECEDEYAEWGRCLEGDILVGQKRYEEAVQVYLDIKSMKSLSALKKLLFYAPVQQEPEFRRNLEYLLTDLRDDENTDRAIRAELYQWYGLRYMIGKDIVKSEKFAYINFVKANQVSRSNDYDDDINACTRDMNVDEKRAFLREVLDEGCYEAACELGEMYLKKYRMEDAMGVFEQGMNHLLDSKRRKLCEEGYELCSRSIRKRNVFRDEAEPAYNMCRKATVSEKEPGFSRLWALAKNGNTYAALRYAQIAERDVYLQEHAENFPTEGFIFSCYKAAAQDGEIEAISRMAEIFENGELGQRKDKQTAEKWRAIL